MSMSSANANRQQSQQPAEKTMAESIEIYRIQSAYRLSLFGLLFALGLAVLLVIQEFETADITSLVGLFTTLLGSLVGAFFGIQIGSTGKERAEQRADKAEERVDVVQHQLQAVTAVGNEDLLKKAMEKYPDYFKLR